MSLEPLFAAADAGTETKARQCAKHGSFLAQKIVGSVWTQCPACAAERAAEEEQRKAAKAEAERRISANNAMRYALIPPRFTDRTLENYRVSNEGQKTALQIATRYADDLDAVLRVGRCLVFCGMPGTGKTHLAIGIAKRFIAKGYSVRYTSAMNAIRAVRDTYRKDSKQTEREVISEFANPDLVIIDEVGNQLDTDAEKVTLFDLIDARYGQLKPMIVISNLRLDEMSKFLGERAIDRLRENGGVAVAFPWDSHRQEPD